VKSFDVQRSSVTQNAVNDNHSFDVLERTPKKVAEDHTCVGTIGNDFRQWGNGLFATVTMFLIIHGTMQT
jgi:hypothetical protein